MAMQGIASALESFTASCMPLTCKCSAHEILWRIFWPVKRASAPCRTYTPNQRLDELVSVAGHEALQGVLKRLFGEWRLVESQSGMLFSCTEQGRAAWVGRLR